MAAVLRQGEYHRVTRARVFSDTVPAKGVRHLPRKSVPLPGRADPTGRANFPVAMADLAEL